MQTTYSPSSAASSKLPVHEWMAAMALIILLAVLTAIVLFSNEKPLLKNTEEEHYVVSQEIEVKIEGAVQKTGSYRVKRGTLLGDVLKEAEPADDADLTRLKLDRPVRKGQVIKVRKRKPPKIPS